MEDQADINRLEERIIQTVREYMKGVPRPFGVLVSGGLDSGILAAITKPNFIYRVRIPFGKKYDETKYAEAIIHHLGLEKVTREIILSPDLFEDNIEKAVKAMGEVTTHFSIVPFYILMHAIAKEKGEGTHILSGEGPDEYLAGYSRQIIVSETQRLLRIPELMNYQETVKKWIPMADEPVMEYGRQMKYPEEKVEEYQALYKNGSYPLQGIIGKMDMDLGGIEKMELKMAKDAKINLHYPFLDNHLADFCYHLRDDVKIRGGITKWVFRQVAKKYLPKEVIFRHKMGGPVAPVNLIMDWMDDGEFGKKNWIEYQKNILK